MLEWQWLFIRDRLLIGKIKGTLMQIKSIVTENFRHIILIWRRRYRQTVKYALVYLERSNITTYFYF